MLPVLALVGRPNVGKSTLFNVLTRPRDAIVADIPGLTRDRQYGFGRVGPIPYVVIDTGGLVENPTGIETQMREQTEQAVQEADRLVFLTDVREGLTPAAHFVLRELRRSGKPGTTAHVQGCKELMDQGLACLEPETATAEDPDSGAIRIAIIGRPNVGKSTL